MDRWIDGSTDPSRGIRTSVRSRMGTWKTPTATSGVSVLQVRIGEVYVPQWARVTYFKKWDRREIRRGMR